MAGQSSFRIIGRVWRNSAIRESRSAGLHKLWCNPAVQSKVMPSCLRLAFARSKSCSLHFSYSPTNSTLVYPACATFSRRCSKGRSRKIVHNITDKPNGASALLAFATGAEDAPAAVERNGSIEPAKIPPAVRVKVRLFIFLPPFLILYGCRSELVQGHRQSRPREFSLLGYANARSAMPSH